MPTIEGLILGGGLLLAALVPIAVVTGRLAALADRRGASAPTEPGRATGLGRLVPWRRRAATIQNDIKIAPDIILDAEQTQLYSSLYLPPIALTSDGLVVLHLVEAPESAALVRDGNRLGWRPETGPLAGQVVPADSITDLPALVDLDHLRLPARIPLHILFVVDHPPIADGLPTGYVALADLWPFLARRHRGALPAAWLRWWDEVLIPWMRRGRPPRRSRLDRLLAGRR